MKIGLLSDTHGHLDDGIFKFLEPCDEVWHAGDIGPLEKAYDPLVKKWTVRAVYGNIDDHKARSILPEIAGWEMEGKSFLMTHIAGKPPRYAKGIAELLDRYQPDVLICGHSHILKIMKDPKRNVLFMNPGAAGIHGFHQVRTLVRFDLKDGQLSNLEVLELPRKA